MEQMQIDWLRDLALLSLIPRSTMRISIGMEYVDGQPTHGSWLNVWGLAAVSEDVNDMPSSYLRQGCVDTDVLQETD